MRATAQKESGAGVVGDTLEGMVSHLRMAPDY